MVNNKKEIQSGQYRFPYHYIPDFDKKGSGVRYKVLGWGLEYLCYQGHVKALVESLSPKSVIEVGCGDGRFIGSLPADFRRLGVDLDHQAIGFAKLLNHDVEFLFSPAEEVDEVFDICVAIEVLEHVPDEAIKDFINTLFSKVHDQGYVIITVPTTVLPLNKKHYRHYTEDLLLEQLKASSMKFSLVSTEYIYKEPFWLKLYLKTSINRYWILEFYWLRKVVWNWIWKSLRYADKETGHHLVIVARKEK